MLTYYPYLLRGRSCRFCRGMVKAFVCTIPKTDILQAQQFVDLPRIDTLFVSKKFMGIRLIFRILSLSGYLGGKSVCLRFVICRDLNFLLLEVLSLPFVLSCLDCAHLKRESNRTW